MARRKRKRKRRNTKQPWTEGFPCPKCGSYDIRKSLTTFTGGVIHVRNECGACGKFLKWGGEPDEFTNPCGGGRRRFLTAGNGAD